MAKTRHKNPRTAMRYVEPGAEAIVLGQAVAREMRKEPPHVPKDERGLLVFSAGFEPTLPSPLRELGVLGR